MKTRKLFSSFMLAVVMILNLASAPVASAHTRASVQLRSNTNVRTVQQTSRGTILVRELTLPAGAVVEVPTDSRRNAIPRVYWRMEGRSSPTPFVGGIRLISAPGFGPREIREFNEMSRREGLYVAKGLVDSATEVRVEPASSILRFEERTTVLRDHDMRPQPATGASAPGVSQETAQRIVEQIERGNESVRSTTDVPSGCQDCSDRHFQNWVRAGVPERALRNALDYYNNNRGRIRNSRYITIVDFTAHSSEKRMFILDTATGAVERHYSAHGSGSDPRNSGRVQSFSGRNNSHATPRGFHLTGEAYRGRHGLSMRLDGLESENRTSRARAIVLHGADYASASFIRAHGRAGRSWGCLAVDPRETRSMVERLQGGSLVYNFGG
jgi:hypothetical protein